MRFLETKSIGIYIIFLTKYFLKKKKTNVKGKKKPNSSDEKKKTQREDVLDLIGDFDRVFFDEISVKEGENLELIMNGIGIFSLNFR